MSTLAVNAINAASGGTVTITGAALTTPALGTPASGTLTNCTGFPVANLSGTTMPSAVVNSSLNAITPSGGALDVSGNLSATGVVSSGSGFRTTTYTSSARNRIWSFGNNLPDSDGIGISFFQGSSGYGGDDSIGFHFGTATSGASTLNVLNNERGVAVSGQVFVGMHESLNATHRGLKFRINGNTDDFGGVTMEMGTGVVRYTAGYSGWGGSHEWYANGVKAMELTSGGSTYNITGTYGSISDAKLKRDVTDATTKLTKVLAMRVVNYFLIADPSNTKLLGMIAQELREISPGLVDETPDYEDVIVEQATDDQPAVIERRRTGTTTLSIKYSVLVPMLVKALQEMHADFDSRLRALEAKA